jgi:hypothetical protein
MFLGDMVSPAQTIASSRLVRLLRFSAAQRKGPPLGLLKHSDDPIARFNNDVALLTVGCQPWFAVGAKLGNPEREQLS